MNFSENSNKYFCAHLPQKDAKQNNLNKRKIIKLIFTSQHKHPPSF